MTLKELIFGLIGGTALLMYGVDKMGEGLEKASGDMMKKILSVLTGRVWSAFLVGTFLTALVQSSTAITVLTVGFVNAGLMKLPQAIGIIYGANIGTTITAQLMSFSFDFKLTDIALPVIGIGFLTSYFLKQKTLKSIGEALMGFGFMFLGLKILNGGIPFMQNSESLKYFFETYAAIPIVGVLLGAMATALVHSSSATVALVMVLAQAGLIDLQTSICIMLGDNIGTCITAQLASLTGNIHARRTAWAHTLYNIIGVLVVAAILPLFVNIVTSVTAYLQPGQGINAQIANSHTIFNLLSALVFLPITKYYVKFLETIIKDRKGEDDSSILLDKLLLETPVAALRAVLGEVVRAAEITKEMFSTVMEAFYNNDEARFEVVLKKENRINELQKDISLYMVELSKKGLTDTQSIMVPALLSSINNIERIGDNSQNLLELVQSKIDKKLSFSEEAINEINLMQVSVLEMYDCVINSLKTNDEKYTLKALQLEEEIDALTEKLSSNHLERLKAGYCSIESGVIFLDIVSVFERIADHMYKISVSPLEDLKGLPRNELTEIM